MIRLVVTDKILLILFFILLFFKTQAAQLSGKITDTGNETLPYVIVYVSGTSNGTTANSEGMYVMELLPGTYEISFRMIGFALLKKQVVINSEPVRMDVQLNSESVNLREVTIRADAEDFAYPIIRSAQKKRKYYRDQVEVYSSHAYVKSTQHLTNFPKKLFGKEINIGDVMDTTTKLLYLSESVSELYFHKPDKFKEKMISSKVSGSPRTYSFNQATSVLISFYDNLVDLSGLTPRGIVSPISANAIFFYNYRLEGTFSENGVMVNKITVIPKRNSDPVFRGTIYITEDTWRIYSVDLLITKDQQMDFVDTFLIKQNFIKVNEETWMPFSHQFYYSFSAMGFKGNGVVLGVFSDYNLSPEIKSSYFDGEVLKVDATANKKDSAYWSSVRPVPLTGNESTDYHRRDSSLVIRESKSYLDSIDKKTNKFKMSSIISGYSWENSYRNVSIDIVSPVQKILFNTVEGWNTSMSIAYNKDFGRDDRREYQIKPSVRYGLSNSHFNGHVLFNYYYNPRKLATIEFDGGTNLVQINGKNPISGLINSLYSLLAEKNYMKVYEKQYFKVSHSSELFNGFSLKLESEYAHRKSIANSSDYKFRNVKNRDYVSNDPYHPSTDLMRFPSHNAFTIEAGISIRPGQEYIDRPESKYVIGSKFPVFRVNYKKGLYVAGSDIDYDLIQLGIDDDMNMGLLGTLKYMFIYGDFISKKSLFDPDYNHFNGNKTWFSDFRINDFKNLDYYTYSTTDSYIELHAEENFGGFFLNKFPLIRKLKLQEIAGIHFLHTKQLDRYFEFSIGIEKLGIFRAEIFTSMTNGKRGTTGFLIGIKTFL